MDSQAALIQNLHDAGCTQDFIQDFLKQWNGGRTKEELKLLETHRRALLDSLHREQKKIDCLDYLLYRLQASERNS